MAQNVFHCYIATSSFGEWFKSATERKSDTSKERYK